MLKVGIEKKSIKKKTRKNDLSQLGLTSETHETGITSYKVSEKMIQVNPG
jgi:hypothetical protein